MKERLFLTRKVGTPLKEMYSRQHRIGDSWAGRAFHQLFVRYWAVVPG